MFNNIILIFQIFILIFLFFFFFLNINIFRKLIITNKNRLNFSFPFNISNDNRESLRILHDLYMSSWLVGILILVSIIIFSTFINSTTSKKFISRFSVEFRWIVFPSFILLGIGMPSIEYLYKAEEGELENLNLSYKRYGYQWFWTYETLQERELDVLESYIKREINNDSFNYLTSDIEIEVSNFSNINNLVTSGDVIHRWAIPSVIRKTDAIPGRLNSISFFINSLNNEKHYGQCSELCGVNHRFIPIIIKVKQ